MRLDRELQLDVLRTLREAYPADAEKLPHAEDPNIMGNLWYLYEHELIEGVAVEGAVPTFVPHRITARGLDLLEDDGGLSAILGVVTVRFTPDHLRSLMAARIESSELPAEEKSRLADTMRSLSAQTLRDLTTRLVNEAMSRWPDAFRILQTYADL